MLRRMLRTGLLILSVIALSLQSVTAFADTEYGKKAGTYGTPYYDPTFTGINCSTAPTTSGPAVGGDHTEAFLKFLTDKGLSLAAAAGVGGNIKAESGFNPAIIQGGDIAPDTYTPVSGVGFGLAQWTSGGRQQALLNFARSKGAKITDFNMQMEFMWKEMNSSGYKEVVSKLNANKSDPVQAAIDFHNIFERSADSAAKVREVRGAFATAMYNQYKGRISDGGGVKLDPSSGTEASTAQSCSNNGDDSIAPGSGNFKDSGQVAGWENVLHNAKATNRLFGGSLVNDGYCAAIVSRVWRGANIGWATNGVGVWASSMWQVLGRSIGHPDRNPKAGAVLLYIHHGQSPYHPTDAGHVVIYLGNNKILNDGQIVDADFPEKKWNLQYVGWIDPNQVGWNQVKAASDGELRSWLGGY
ncbi:MAG TPA: phage tail tip lysozyme [Candidatus Saccharimonadales bacterium]|nr:phage tail tip lysozyme [Candidatus Saccharimonadales bacterium]